MRNSLPFSLLCLLFLSAVSSVPAQPESDRLEAEPTESRHASARTGMSRGALVAQLGAPTERLSESIWVYTDFYAKDPRRVEKTDTLIVVFKGNRVTHLRLTQYALIAPAIAQARTNARMIASK